MLWTIIVVLLVLWLLGFIGHFGGALIHLLLVIAVMVLIIVGVIGFAWGGLGWTTQKKDAQLGPLEITHKESHGIAFPPIASGICLVGGIVLLIVGSRKS